MAWGNRFDPLASMQKRQKQRADAEAKKQAKPIKVKTDKDKWEINVRGGEWLKNGSFRFLVCGAHYPDLDGLDKKFASTGIFHCNARDTVQGLGRWLVVRPQQMDNFKQIIPEIGKYFRDYKINSYTEGSINGLEDDFKKAIVNTPTLEEIKVQDEKVLDNWRDIVTSLMQDKTKKRLMKTQVKFVNDPVYAAAALSPRNVAEILMVDPDATFCTSEWTWERVFKRRVLPNSPYAIITKAVVPGQQVGRGIAFAQTKYRNKSLGAAQSFFKTKVYDVRFTEPLDPNDDPFLSLENQLSNNINPKLNQAYADALSQSGVNVSDISSEQPLYGLTNDKSKGAFLNHISSLCGKKNIVLGNGSFEDIVSQGIYSYAVEEAIRLNKLKAYDQDAFASAVLLAVSNTYNFESILTKKAYDKIRQVPTYNLESMAREMYPLYLRLVNFSHVVQEAIGDENVMTFEEFCDFLGNISLTNEKVTEEFNKFMNRLGYVK